MMFISLFIHFFLMCLIINTMFLFLLLRFDLFGFVWNLFCVRLFFREYVFFEFIFEMLEVFICLRSFSMFDMYLNF